MACPVSRSTGARQLQQGLFIVSWFTLAPAPSLAVHNLGSPIEIVLAVDLTGTLDDVAARAARMAEVIVKATEMAGMPAGSGSPLLAPRFAAMGFDDVGASLLWDFAEWDVSGPRLFHSLRTGAVVQSLVSPGSRSAPSRVLAELARNLLQPTVTWARWSSSPETDVGLFNVRTDPASPHSVAVARTAQNAAAPAEHRPDVLVLSTPLPLVGRYTVTASFAVTSYDSHGKYWGEGIQPHHFPRDIWLGLVFGDDDAATELTETVQDHPLHLRHHAVVVSSGGDASAGGTPLPFSHQADFEISDRRLRGNAWQQDTLVEIVVDMEARTIAMPHRTIAIPDHIVIGDAKVRIACSLPGTAVIAATVEISASSGSGASAQQQTQPPHTSSGYRGQLRPHVLIESVFRKSENNSEFQSNKVLATETGASIHVVSANTSLAPRGRLAELTNPELGGVTVDSASPTAWLCQTGIFGSICSYKPAACPYAPQQCPATHAPTPHPTTAPPTAANPTESPSWSTTSSSTSTSTSTTDGPDETWAGPGVSGVSVDLRGGFRDSEITTTGGCRACPVCASVDDEVVELHFRFTPPANSLSAMLNRSVNIEVVGPAGAHLQYVTDIKPGDSFQLSAPFPEFFSIALGNASRTHAAGSSWAPHAVWISNCNGFAKGTSPYLSDAAQGFTLYAFATTQSSSGRSTCSQCQRSPDVVDFARRGDELVSNSVMKLVVMVICALVVVLAISLIVVRRWRPKTDPTDETNSRLENGKETALNAPKVSKNTKEGLSWDVGDVGAAATTLPGKMVDRTYDTLHNSVQVKGKNPLYLGSEPSQSGTELYDSVLSGDQISSTDGPASSMSSYKYGVVADGLTDGISVEKKGGHGGAEQTVSLGNSVPRVTPASPSSENTTQKKNIQQVVNHNRGEISANVRSTPDVGYIGVAGIEDYESAEEYIGVNGVAESVPAESDKELLIPELDESQGPSLITSHRVTGAIQEPHSSTGPVQSATLECTAAMVHQSQRNVEEQLFSPKDDNDCVIMGIHRQKDISPGKKFKRSPVKEMVNDCHIIGMPRVQPVLPTCLDSEPTNDSDGCGTPPPTSESDGAGCSPFVFPDVLSGDANSSDGASQPSTYQNAAFTGAFGRRAWTGAIAEPDDNDSTRFDESTETADAAADGVVQATYDAGTPVFTTHRASPAPDPIYGDSGVRESLVEPIYERIDDAASGSHDDLNDSQSCSSEQFGPSTEVRVVFEEESPSEASAPSPPPLSEIPEESLDFASIELFRVEDPTYDNNEYDEARAENMLSRARLSRVMSGPAEEDFKKKFKTDHAGDFVDNFVDVFSVPPGNLPSSPGDIRILPDESPSKFVTRRSLYSDSEFKVYDNAEYVDTFLESIMPAMVGFSAVVKELKSRHGSCSGSSTWVAVADLPAGWTAAVDPVSGITYYINASEAVTQWDHPDPEALATSARPEAGAKAEETGKPDDAYAKNRHAFVADDLLYSVQKEAGGSQAGTDVTDEITDMLARQARHD